ncbi:MAG: hydrogen gas-evolving membrane-bound hydrogenase subunit E [PVC group bacterium]
MVGLYILLLLMIIAAIAAVEMKDLLSSVVAVGAVGLGLSVTFLLLKAPDLAITQLVVEILCLIILIRATIKRDVYSKSAKREWARAVVALIFSGVFLFFAWLIVKDLSPFGRPEMRVSDYYLREGLNKTGAANLVTSIILDFRAYDTLGEATVLFTAVIGALAVMRRVGRRKAGGKNGEE